jgi:hypothetical protein
MPLEWSLGARALEVDVGEKGLSQGGKVFSQIVADKDADLRRFWIRKGL